MTGKEIFLLWGKIPDSYRLLQTELEDGIVDKSIATILGKSLADMHNKTENNSSICRTFDNIDMIKQIKLPLIYDNITSDPKEIIEIKKLKNNLLSNKICLVHGDFKPNNIFVSNNNIILIDFEQTYYGDPLLDFAYLPSSYIVNSFLNLEKQKLYFYAADEYWKEYLKNINFKVDERIALQHLGVILLSRVDGVIKYNCLQQNNISSLLRKFAKKLILKKISSLDECTNILINMLHKVREDVS